jgi:hypothetical protein
MKKLILSASVTMMLFSCQKDMINQSSENLNAADQISTRGCAAQDVLDYQLKNDPSLALRRNEIEQFTQNFVAAHKNDSDAKFRLVNGSIEIPVVVNVLYRTDAQNVSDAQIQSQIDVLNKDFNAQNADFNNPSPYDDVKANVGITFVLDAVVRKQSQRGKWSQFDQFMKYDRYSGVTPTSPTTKLNIWVVNEIYNPNQNNSSILGYAQFPGGSPSTDGVVIGYKYFGTVGTAVKPFNLGRTTTHEVGHWMNLRHIWGDANCGNDQVDDTPTMDSPNFGKPIPGLRSTCTGNPLEMYMNYMDYVDDDAMYMFSNGQKSRIDATFAENGPRASFR